MIGPASFRALARDPLARVFEKGYIQYMTDYRFYHLTRSRLETALPALLEKTLAQGKRAVVRTSSPERTEALAAQLWTYGQATFLPHGTDKDGRAAEQPIWITDRDENPNGAPVLFLTDGAECACVDAYDLVADLFDGHDEDALAAARRRFAAAKTAGHALSYWQQGEKGWTKAV